MSQAVETPLSSYLPTGTNVGPFATVWTYADPVEVRVVIVDAAGAETVLAVDDDYTVAATGGNSLANGGGVTLLLSAIPDGEWDGQRLVLQRVTPAAQPSSFVDVAGFRPQDVASVADKLTRILQEVLARIGAAVRAPFGEAGHVLPSRDALKGRLLWGDPTSGSLRVLTDLELIANFQGPQGVRGPTGAIGGNVMAVGLFVGCEGMAVPAGTELVHTTGYSAVGVGRAAFSTRRFKDGSNATSPWAVTFTAADGRVFEMLPGEGGWSASAFGAAEGASAEDNYAAFQAAIDHALWLDRNGFGAQQVFVDPGQYTISQALQVFAYDEDTGTFYPATVSITAPAGGYTVGLATSIQNTNIDQPTVVIAKAREVYISNLGFLGANTPYLPTFYEFMGDPAVWANPEGMRDEQYSPACGIVIDPFSSTVPGDGGYPGLTQYYTTNGGSSSIINLENVLVQGFPVGICVSPSTDTQIGDSVTVRDSNLLYNTYCLATCQSQNRAVHLEKSRVGGCYTAIVGDKYGNQQGSFTHCSDLNVTGCKFLLSGGGEIGSGVLSNCAVESTFSLGSWNGGFALDIHSCHIKLAPPVAMRPPANNGSPDGYIPAPDYHLLASGPVNFYGGYFGSYTSEPVPLSIAGAAIVSFHGTALDTPPLADSFDRIRYFSVPLWWHDAGRRYGVNETLIGENEDNIANAVSAVMPLGGRLVAAPGTGLETVYRAGAAVDVVALDTATITVTGDGRATFPITVPGKYQVGEWLSTATQWTAPKPNDGTTIPTRYTSIGQVMTVTSDTVTLRHVPEHLVTASHAIVAQGLRPFRRRCLGTATSGNNVLTGVVPSSHGFRAGERVKANSNIPAGTYITAVDTGAGTITLSQNAAGSGSTRVENVSRPLEHAPRPGEPSSGVTFAGDFFEYAGASVDGNNMALRGWLATTDGNPGTFVEIYDSTVSPAT